MSELISLNQVLLLSGFHFVLVAILYSVGHFLLPGAFRWRLMIFLAIIFGWSVIAVLMLYIQEDGFLGWLFNPAGEKNATALFNTTLLMLIAITGFSLAWAGRQKSKYALTIYWLLVGSLFFFLALDEYFSIHETIVYWRGGYLILGGIVAFVSLIVALRGDVTVRSIMFMFIFGVGCMGLSGVVLDAFSAESLLDIGPIKLTFIQCRGQFMGLNCREFGNTEEMLELAGAAIAGISLTALSYDSLSKQALRNQRRFVYGAGIAWVLSLIVWMWVMPEVEVRFAESAYTDYDDISLIAYRLDSTEIQPGDSLNLTIYAQANTVQPATYSMSVHLYTRSYPLESIAQDDMELGEFVYPSRAWLPRVAVRNQFQLDIPDDLPLNQSYQLIAIVWEESIHNRIAVQETIFEMYTDGETLVIEGIAAPDNNTSPGTRSINYHFDAGFTLSDFSLPQTVLPGETVTFDFLWDVSEHQDIAATQFMHWFNVDTGEYIVFDHIPREGLFPTGDWVAGMSLQDSWSITVPDDIEPGTYRVQTGMFETASGNRLAVRETGGNIVQDNSIVLGEIVVGDE